MCLQGSEDNRHPQVFYLHHYEPLLFSSNFPLKDFEVPRTTPAAFLSKRSAAADQLFLHHSFTALFTCFLILHDFSRALLKWEFVLYHFPGELKDLWVREEMERSGVKVFWDCLIFFRLFSGSEHLKADSLAQNDSILPLN